jgi:glycosyltransferase involved in cell wall biosynthesis
MIIGINSNLQPSKFAMTEVLYLSYDGITDPLGRSQVLPYLQGISAAGYHIHLISFEKPEAFKREGSTVRAIIEKTGIAWYPQHYTKNPPVISTLLDLKRMYQKGLALIRKHNIRLVHCRSYISGIAGLKLKNTTGAAFLFDMRGFWADERVEGKIWNLSNPLYRTIYNFFKRKEKTMLMEADGVISLTHAAKKVIDNWSLRSKNQLPVEVIPCCADLSLFTYENADLSIKRAALKIELKLENEGPVLSYLGAIGTWYLLDDMMRFFRALLNRFPSAVFLFITREESSVVFKAADALNIAHDRIRVRAADREQIPAMLSLSQVSVFFILSSFSKTASSPTKQGEIMGMGIPLICNSGVGDTDYVVNTYGSGLSINLEDPESFEKTVAAFDKISALDPRRIREGALAFYSLDIGISLYTNYYKKILNRSL